MVQGPSPAAQHVALDSSAVAAYDGPIPIIDLSPFWSPTADADAATDTTAAEPGVTAAAAELRRRRQEEAADAIRRACTDVGFFYVVNHGVPQATIDAAFGAARDFFALAEADKRALDSGRSYLRRGYTPVGGAHNCKPAGECGAVDLKESFVVGT